GVVAADGLVARRRRRACRVPRRYLCRSPRRGARRTLRILATVWSDGVGGRRGYVERRRQARARRGAEGGRTARDRRSCRRGLQRTGVARAATRSPRGTFAGASRRAVVDRAYARQRGHGVGLPSRRAPAPRAAHRSARHRVAGGPRAPDQEPEHLGGPSRGSVERRALLTRPRSLDRREGEAQCARACAEPLVSHATSAAPTVPWRLGFGARGLYPRSL